MLKKALSILLCAVILTTWIAVVSGEPESDELLWTNVYTFGSSDTANSVVSMQTIDGKNFLFLPSGVDANNLPIYFSLNKEPDAVSMIAEGLRFSITSGQNVHLDVISGQKTEYQVTLIAKYKDQEAALDLTIVPIQGIGNVFLVSDDPVNHGRAWVEASPDKSNKATGAMFMQGADGTVVYDGLLKQIKGRGNSTWAAEKKPYQIKLDKKTDLLQTGDSQNKAKTWVLLTNAADPTLLRNNLVYDLSVAVGLAPGIQCEPINLFYDGEYRGAYLLCEKVEIGSGRVDIADLEGENEAVNPEITDFDALTIRTGTTANGATYTYCEGMKNPADYTGGYLLEMDTAVRAMAEKCYFITKNNNYVVVKSPEYCSKEQIDYIATYYQDFEDTLYHKGVHPSNGKSITDYASMEALASCYLVNELTKNPDGYRTSTYLYKDANSDVMTFGPIWDYDLSFGLSWGEFINSAMRPEGLFTIYSHIAENLYEIPQFRQTVHDIYLNKFAPLLTDVLISGTREALPLQSFSGYRSELRSSAYANGILWNMPVSEWEIHNSNLLGYITARNLWLTATFEKWSADSYDALNSYTDVNPGEWFYEEVIKATNYGILNGMSHGIFSPMGNTTRAQAAKVLFEISGAASPVYESVFSDVSQHDWYAPAVTWAAKNSVVLGYDDGSFHPNTPISRQDFVVLLYRFLKAPPITGDVLSAFADAGTISGYASQAIHWAVATGLVQGYEDNTLRPFNHITRAELATMIVRFYEDYAFIK